MAAKPDIKIAVIALSGAAHWDERGPFAPLLNVLFQVSRLIQAQKIVFITRL